MYYCASDFICMLLYSCFRRLLSYPLYSTVSHRLLQPPTFSYYYDNDDDDDHDYHYYYHYYYYYYY